MIKNDIFQAIADPTRRAIIALIATQSMTPGALAEHFECTRQAVSKHIKVLTDCDLLKQEKTGREIYYHFNEERMGEVEAWLQQIKQHWQNRFSQLDKVLNNLKTNKDEK